MPDLPISICAKKLSAATSAKSQAQGTDIFTEAERINDMTAEDRGYYERYMANTFGIKPASSKRLNSTGGEGVPPSRQRSAWDATKKTGEKVDGQMFDRPSQIFSKKFYGAIDARITAWEKNKAKQSYSEGVGNPAKSLLKAIDTELKGARTPKQIDARMAKFGLDSKTVYAGKDYLTWLSKGGHTQQESNRAISVLNNTGSNIAKAQASLQLTWTLGNGADMQRVYSHYLTRKPSSVVNVIQGTVDAIAATKGQPWRRIPELEAKGVYGSDYQDRGGKNLTPFELSITAQKNLVYHLDKAAGGDGLGGIRDQLFDSSPWDRPVWDRSPDTKLLFGLARYPINEARWLFKTVGAAARGNHAEQANLLLYGLGRAFFFGSASMIPQWAVNEKRKEQLKNFDEAHGLNQVRTFSREMFSKFGINAELDFSSYLSPLGGSLGSRASSLKTTADKAGKNATESVFDLAKGNVAAAGVRAVGAASALNNLTNWGKAVKLLGAMNSTEITDLMDTVAKGLEGEFKKPDQLPREAAKDLFGGTIKKPEKPKATGLPELPELPELPAAL